MSVSMESSLPFAGRSPESCVLLGRRQVPQELSGLLVAPPSSYGHLGNLRLLRSAKIRRHRGTTERGGPFWSAGAFQQVDLGASLSFGGNQKDQSAQFLSECAGEWRFWDALLKTMGLKP
jgi:hypothetical protein